MIWELIHTSAPRGLHPGTRGFTTVAQTKGMPAWLSEALGRMSAYRSVSDPSGSSAGASPVVYRHARLIRGSESYSVLSRIAPCSDDYSGRSNRMAHHLVLDDRAQDAVSAGPAWLLSRDDLFCQEWNKEPQHLGPRSGLPNADVKPKPCRSWERATGDAGWAGEVLRRAFERSGRGFYLRYRRDHNILAMLTEASALLPPQLRWNLTFQAGSMDDPPAELTCALRCVPAITGVQPGIRGMTPDNTMDLTARQALGDSAYAQKARRGEQIEVKAPRAVHTMGNVVSGPSSGEHHDRAGALNRQTDGNDAAYDLAPFDDMAAGADGPPVRAPRISHASDFEPDDVRKRIVASGLAGVVVGLIIGIPVGVKFFSASQTTDIQQPSEILTESVGDEQETTAPVGQPPEPFERSPTRRSREHVAKHKERQGDGAVTGTTRPNIDDVPQKEPEQESSEVASNAGKAAKPAPTPLPTYSSPPVVQVQWTKSVISDADVHEFEFDPAVFDIGEVVHLPKEWLDADNALQIAWLADSDGSMAETPVWKINGSQVVHTSYYPLEDVNDEKDPEPVLEVHATIESNGKDVHVSWSKLNDDGPFAEVAGFCIRHPLEKRARLLLWHDSNYQSVRLSPQEKDDENSDSYRSSQFGPVRELWFSGKNRRWDYTMPPMKDGRSNRKARYNWSFSDGPAMIASFERREKIKTEKIWITVDRSVATTGVGDLETRFLKALRAALQPAVEHEQPNRSVILPNLYGVPMIEIVFPEPRKERDEQESHSSNANPEDREGGAP